jgi:hypothetical protein
MVSLVFAPKHVQGCISCKAQHTPDHGQDGAGVMFDRVIDHTCGEPETLKRLRLPCFLQFHLLPTSEATSSLVMVVDSIIHPLLREHTLLHSHGSELLSITILEQPFPSSCVRVTQGLARPAAAFSLGIYACSFLGSLPSAPDGGNPLFRSAHAPKP